MGKLEQNFKEVKRKKIREIRRLTGKHNRRTDTRFWTVKVKGDGNCFYRCVSLWQYNHEGNHNKVRQCVVEHIASNKSAYAAYIDGNIDNHLRDQRCTDGRTSSWATEAEIYATATLLGIDIFIHGDEQDLKFGPLSGKPGSTQLHVNLRNNHFDFLQQKNGDVRIEPNTGSKKETFDWFDLEQSSSDMASDSATRRYTGLQSPIQDIEPSSKTIPNDNRVDMDRPNCDETREREKEEKERNSYQKKDKNEYVVTNLSSRKLSEAEHDLLSKGLSFIPTQHNIDIWKVQSELAEWERRMRLREYFAGQNDESDVEEEEDDTGIAAALGGSKKKKRSNFTPKPGRNKWLDAYIEAVKKDVIEGISKKVEMNINKKEERAMKSLLQDNDIIIRPADKGSGIVVMDTQKYIDGLEEEMLKSNSYEQTVADKYQETEKLVKKTVNRMYKNGHINDELKKYLVPKLAKPGRLKGNPKLHKKKRPLRTIVNGIGTPTEKMAEVAEFQLNEYVEQSPSYIKDTTDFLRKLDKINVKLPTGAILFCFDVEKLYPSIPREEGLQACEEALSHRSNQAFSSEAVMEMIRAVLDNNAFQFNRREYIQKDGVAIGSRLGRNYACAYMRKWDEALAKFEKTAYGLLSLHR